MKGLELSELYFERYGRGLIEELKRAYPALEGQFAAGLVGQGSECLGFDDGLSTDHDFGPSFCLWLEKELYSEYAARCQEAYDRLPGAFLGVPPRRVMEQGQGRVGVLCLEDFYFGLLGRAEPPKTNAEWLALPESRLSLATNGRVFLDEKGRFTQIRDALLSYYPEDVRKKKIAARAAAMAQSGQYNYSRLCRRGEWTGALLALGEFVQTTCSMVHLLNRRYTPFYKWMHKSLQGQALLPEVYGLLDQLSEGFDNRSAWREAKEEDFLYGVINAKDQNAVLIETICQLVIRELERQGLSDAGDMYLEPHAISVMGKIRDPQLAALPLLYG